MDDFFRQRDCCGYWNLTAEEAGYREYWSLVNSEFIRTYSDAINMMIFGESCQKYSKKLLFFHLLYAYMVQVRAAIILAGTEDDVAENKVLYHLDDLEKTMVCYGFPPKLIKGIMAIFGFEQSVVELQDGINYMAVQEGTPLFITA